MNWKTKLIAATGAFVSMPVATIAEVNTLCGARRAAGPFRQKISSAPIIIDQGVVQELTVAGSLPKTGDTEEDKLNGELPDCSSYGVIVAVKDATNGTKIHEATHVIQQGTGFVSNLGTAEMGQARAITAEVEIIPIAGEGENAEKVLTDQAGASETLGCQSTEAHVSFSVNGFNGRDYVPFEYLKINLSDVLISTPPPPN